MEWLISTHTVLYNIYNYYTVYTEYTLLTGSYAGWIVYSRG